MFRIHMITMLSALVFTASAAAIPTIATAKDTCWWKPAVGATWNIDLLTSPTVFSPASNTSIYDLDLFNTNATTIAALQASGHKVICYYSAGSWEDWRPDASQFPAAAIGKPLDGWKGEKWLDTRSAAVRQLMSARIQLAKDKGCDGVDPDNIDGYENDPGFPLTHATAVDYVTYLSGVAHNLSMASGLKNGNDIVKQLVNVTDWELNEQCAQYDECDTLQPFLDAGKPVFHVEYTTAKSQPGAAFVKRSCGPAVKGFSTLLKHLSLNTWTALCPNGTVVPF